MQNIRATIEISALSKYPIKYELDKNSNALIVDRFIKTNMQYPCNYGFIPETLGLDDDPLDILVISPYPLLPSCSISCRAIGILKMIDDGGIDDKIISVPDKKITDEYNDIRNIKDLPLSLLNQIKYFFNHYKDSEENKWTKVEDFGSQEETLNTILSATERFKKNCKR